MERILEELETLKLKCDSYDQKLRVLQSSHNEMLTLKGMFSFPTFYGKDGEDVSGFISRFIRVANIYEISKEKRAEIMPLYFADSALHWFNSKPERSNMNFDELTESLVKHYESSAVQFQLREMLSNRKQGENESVTSYSSDIRKYCSRLGLPQNEHLVNFMNGLKPEIKEYVVLKQPLEYDTAEELAKLKEYVEGGSMLREPESSGNSDIDEEDEFEDSVCSIEIRKNSNSKSEVEMHEDSQPVMQGLVHQASKLRKDVEASVIGKVRHNRKGLKQNNPSAQRKRKLHRPRKRARSITCNYCQKPRHTIFECRNFNPQTNHLSAQSVLGHELFKAKKPKRHKNSQSIFM